MATAAVFDAGGGNTISGGENPYTTDIFLPPADGVFITGNATAEVRNTVVYARAPSPRTIVATLVVDDRNTIMMTIVNEDNDSTITATLYSDPRTPPATALLTMDFAEGMVIDAPTTQITITTYYAKDATIGLLAAGGNSYPPYTYRADNTIIAIGNDGIINIAASITAIFTQTIRYVALDSSVPPLSLAGSITLIAQDPPQATATIDNPAPFFVLPTGTMTISISGDLTNYQISITTGKAEEVEATTSIDGLTINISTSATGILSITISIDDNHPRTPPISLTATIAALEHLTLLSPAAFYNALTLGRAAASSILTATTSGNAGDIVYAINGDEDATRRISINSTSGILQVLSTPQSADADTITLTATDNYRAVSVIMTFDYIAIPAPLAGGLSPPLPAALTSDYRGQFVVGGGNITDGGRYRYDINQNNKASIDISGALHIFGLGITRATLTVNDDSPLTPPLVLPISTQRRSGEFEEFAGRRLGLITINAQQYNFPFADADFPANYELHDNRHLLTFGISLLSSVNADGHKRDLGDAIAYVRPVQSFRRCRGCADSAERLSARAKHKHAPSPLLYLCQSSHCRRVLLSPPSA